MWTNLTGSFASEETSIQINAKGFHQQTVSLPRNHGRTVGPGTNTPLTLSDTSPSTPPKKSSVKRFRLSVEECISAAEYGTSNSPRFVEFLADHGEVTGLEAGQNNSTNLVCTWKTVVPKGKHMIVAVELFTTKCAKFFLKFCYSRDGTNFTSHVLCVSYSTNNCRVGRPSIYIPHENAAYFILSYIDSDSRNPDRFRVIFNSTEELLLRKMKKVMTSPLAGYITLPGYNGRNSYAPFMSASEKISLPHDHVLMVSFESFLLQRPIPNFPCFDWLDLFRVEDSGQKETKLWRKCGSQYIAPQVYNLSLRIHFVSDRRVNNIGFKMKFSFHAYTQSPTKLASGLFNCSVSYYTQFKDHVDCNMKLECEGREDERGHCPFSSPACDGSVAVRHKCYTLVRATTKTGRMSFSESKMECNHRHSTLAVIRTKEEWNAFSLYFKHNLYKTRDYVQIGLVPYEANMPQYYRKMLHWIDSSTDYSLAKTQTVILHSGGRSVPRVCSAYDPNRNMVLVEKDTLMKHRFVVCESYTNENKRWPFENKATLPDMPALKNTLYHSGVNFVACPSGVVSVDLFSCHPESHCGVTAPPFECSFSLDSSAQQHLPVRPHHLPMVTTFQCMLKAASIPYSLVCDFHSDCRDRSDEDFCVHDQTCLGFLCKIGQCINSENTCDTFRHCVDGSDEQECKKNPAVWLYPTQSLINSPSIIHFDGEGNFIRTQMKVSEPCPDTHFRCLGEQNDCLPVFVLCNGVYDCFGHEDETECDGIRTCPGYYRCWDSSVCVHPNHMCDGWPQCPRQDDELLCNFTCPRQCRCQGLAFVCHQPFPAQDFPDLRYLDASGSGMRLEQLMDNYYLILIKLQACKLEVLPHMVFKNLLTLNIEENLLTAVNMTVLLPMHNLRVLRLAGNPLTALLTDNSSVTVSKLHTLDISRTQLLVLDSLNFSNMPNLNELNISFSKLGVIQENGFQFLTKMTHLDLRGNFITEYPRNIFKTLVHLHQLFTNDFKLCCRENLPSHFDSISCVFPKDKISSCKDLIRSDSQKVLLWLLCVMSLAGNSGRLLYRFTSRSTVFTLERGMFLSTLCVANFLMGVYLVIVGMADNLYRGEYLWHQNTWMRSVACRAAGVLCLLSSEVSVFIICLIMFDQFIALRCPNASFRFGRKSEKLAAVFVWLTGLLKQF